MPNNPMRLLNQRNDSIVAENVEIAKTIRARLVGLIGRKDLPAGSAFIIPGCRQVHTFLMRFPIEVIFTDAKGRVIGTESVRPNRISGYCRRAVKAIELPAGTISSEDIRMGDGLLIEDSDQ